MRHPIQLTDLHRERNVRGFRRRIAIAIALGGLGLVCLAIAATAAIADGIQNYALPLTGLGLALIGLCLAVAARSA